MLHISIHSSAKPETIHAQAEGTTALFQSTPARCRRQILHLNWTGFIRFQSTPARCRRPDWNIKPVSYVVFQSTPARCRRLVADSVTCGKRGFQSTPARSRRHGGCLSMGKPGNFNPLQREAGDMINCCCSSDSPLFQSTPARSRRLPQFTSDGR